MLDQITSKEEEKVSVKVDKMVSDEPYVAFVESILPLEAFQARFGREARGKVES